MKSAQSLDYTIPDKLDHVGLVPEQKLLPTEETFTLLALSSVRNVTSTQHVHFLLDGLPAETL